MEQISPEGKFLRELSMVERTQRVPVILGVFLSNDEARVQVRDGPPVLLRLTCSREHIARSLCQAGVDVDPPYVGEPDTCPGCPTVEQVWQELLDDLGSYLDHLNHADPDLRLVAVHRDESVARIDVTNGSLDLTHVVRLDSQEMPAAVLVDIATAFGSTPRAADRRSWRRPWSR